MPISGDMIVNRGQVGVVCTQRMSAAVLNAAGTAKETKITHHERKHRRASLLLMAL